MKVLIIGGTGTISTATTRALCSRGHEVVHYNRGQSPSEFAGRVRTIRGDRHCHADFEACIGKELPFDCVIDMIGFTPADAHSLVRAFGARTRQLIFCSTVDVYRKPARSYPIVETADIGARPEFSYAYDKVACEQVLRDAQRSGLFALTIIRPAQTYSDSSQPLSFLGSGLAMLKRIRTGRPILVLGNGLSLWSACHRDDVGLAFANAALNEKTFGQAYHVASDECMTWLDLYRTIARVMRAPEPEFVGIPTALLSRLSPQAFLWSAENFQYDNVFDTTRARIDLGFRSTISWAEGVRRVIAFHDSLNAIDTAEEDPRYDALIEAWQRLSSAMAGKLSRLFCPARTG